MHIRITPVRFNPAREEEVLRLTTEQLLPALRALPGFQHYFGTADRGTPGRGYVITMWDTAEQAEGLRAALSILVAQMQNIGVGLEPSEIHEVVAHA